MIDFNFLVFVRISVLLLNVLILAHGFKCLLIHGLGIRGDLCIYQSLNCLPKAEGIARILHTWLWIDQVLIVEIPIQLPTLIEKNTWRKSPVALDKYFRLRADATGKGKSNAQNSPGATAS